MSNYQPAEVFPPGDFIREELEERGWSQADLAKIIGQDESNVSKIIAGKTAITPTTAKQLANAFGTSAQFWMNLETAYRLANSDDGDDTTVRRAAEIYELAPVREMERRQWIKRTDSVAALEQELTRFFGVPLEDKPRLRAAARASVRSDDESLTPAQVAWCTRAIQLATPLRVEPMTTQGFAKGVDQLRSLTMQPDQARLVPRILASMGIRFVVVEHLPQTRIDGAALWTDVGPVIAMSVRFDRIDNFWHTLFHEISHIRHRDESVLDVDIAGDERIQGLKDLEQRADFEAADTLLPQSKLESFILRVQPMFSKARIIQFAKVNGVHPGIVVGQLAHRKAIEFYHSREMLVKIRDFVTSEAITDGWGKVVALN